MEDESVIFDPNFEQEKKAKLHIIVAGTQDAITMVEAGANEVSNKQMLDMLTRAHEIIKQLCHAQEDFLIDYAATFGIKQIQPTYNNPDVSLYEKVQGFLSEEKLEVLYEKGKKEFQHELDSLDEETKQYLVAQGEYSAEDDMS